MVVGLLSGPIRGNGDRKAGTRRPAKDETTRQMIKSEVV
jgi:hypothetical protein